MGAITTVQYVCDTQGCKNKQVFHFGGHVLAGYGVLMSAAGVAEIKAGAVLCASCIAKALQLTIPVSDERPMPPHVVIEDDMAGEEVVPNKQAYRATTSRGSLQWRIKCFILSLRKGYLDEGRTSLISYVETGCSRSVKIRHDDLLITVVNRLIDKHGYATRIDINVDDLVKNGSDPVDAVIAYVEAHPAIVYTLKYGLTTHTYSHCGNRRESRSVLVTMFASMIPMNNVEADLLRWEDVYGAEASKHGNI